MNFFETLESIQRLHAFIQAEKTGTPEQLAAKLGICRKTLYNIINDLKSQNAPILYSRKKETFYYSKKFNLKLIYTIEIMDAEELTRINGGGSSFFLPYPFLHGRNVIL
jgi:biotin operon repressor